MKCRALDMDNSKRSANIGLMVEGASLFHPCPRYLLSLFVQFDVERCSNRTAASSLLVLDDVFL